MADYATFRLAGLSSPLTASTANTALQDCDPALYWFTQWVKGVVELHCGLRWDAEVTASGLPEFVEKIVTSAVPYDPVPMFQEAHFKLPLLAIYRVDSDFSDATTTWIRRTGTWHLDYILPPLTPAQLERIEPLLSAVEAAIYDRVNQDYDPFVLDGQRLADLMQTESIKLIQARPSRDWLRTTSSERGGSNSVLFRMLHMRFEVAERKLQDTYQAITGVDTTVTVGDVEIAAIEMNQPWE